VTVSVRVAHPFRYLSLAACLGPTFWALMAGWSLLLSAFGVPEMELFVLARPAENLTAIVLTSVSVAWLLRVPIARADRKDATWLAAVSTVLGGALYMFLSLAIGVAFGSEHEGPLSNALGLMMGVIFGGMFSIAFLPVTLPLGWVSIQWLGRVSGGLVGDRVLSAPQTS